MIFEIIVEVALPFIGRVIGYLAIEICGHIIFYFTGYGMLKIVTLGRLPKQFIDPKSTNKQDNYVILVGLVSWVVVVVGAIYLGF